MGTGTLDDFDATRASPGRSFRFCGLTLG